MEDYSFSIICVEIITMELHGRSLQFLYSGRFMPIQLQVSYWVLQWNTIVYSEFYYYSYYTDRSGQNYFVTWLLAD